MMYNTFMKKVFIDGSAGTTGLRIRERLAARDDIELVILPEELRKDTAARRDALNSVDIAFLCLPGAEPGHSFMKCWSVLISTRGRCSCRRRRA